VHKKIREISVKILIAKKLRNANFLQKNDKLKGPDAGPADGHKVEKWQLKTNHFGFTKSGSDRVQIISLFS